MKPLALASALLFASAATCAAGPFASFSDPNHRATPADVARWAAEVIDYSPAPGVGAAFADPQAGIGPASSSPTVVSLGDLDDAQTSQGVAPGSITLKFNGFVFDGPGADLAVFENASTFFADPYVFGELAYVEVSSNGVDFARFDSTSLNIEADDNGMLDADEIDDGFGRNFAGIDSSNVDGLAGIHPAGFGTLFDLANLAAAPQVTAGTVDLMDIRFVRIVDIPGNGAFADSAGRPILDTWLTVDSGGFDLDAIGGINALPEPAALLLAALAMALAPVRRR